MGDDPADAVLVAAAEDAADLMVVGVQGSWGVRPLAGGVTDRLAHHAHRPAVIVPCSVLPGSTS